MDRTWNNIDWQQALLGDAPEIASSWQFDAPEATPVVSLKFPRRRLKVSSFHFSDLGTTPAPVDAVDKPSIDAPRISRPSAPLQQPVEMERRTRLAPPKDVIRIGERLFYTLQPPLESLVSSDTMQFPFEPFDFQYAGVAFLYPRHHAILADEMGLGKTMQAITSIRMLLRTGAAKNVLLICPKPLVTNWQREFATWAPEISVAAISGNPHQRRWHWKHNPSMVRIANYELLLRDQETVIGEDVDFDLVVLDEAQRVKNRLNSTSEVVQKIKRRRSWALTGTPIENSIEDLVGICEFVAPGTVSSNMSVKQVRDGVRDLILRRTKDVVMTDMPPRLMRDTEMQLSPAHTRSLSIGRNRWHRPA